MAHGQTQHQLDPAAQSIVTAQGDQGGDADTIFALSSGGMGVRAGVAVIRVSGPQALRILTHLTTRDNSDSDSLMDTAEHSPRPPPKPRVASYRRLYGYTGNAARGSFNRGGASGVRDGTVTLPEKSLLDQVNGM